MESKAPEPTPGQIQSIQDSPKPQEQVSRVRVHSGHRDAGHSGLDEALKHISAQFRVLNVPLEKSPSVALFGEGWRKWLFFCGEGRGGVVQGP